MRIWNGPRPNSFSVCVEGAIRSIQPSLDPDATGFGDMSVGFKYAFPLRPCQVMTLQFRTTAPTATRHRDSEQPIGWVEPALLYYRKLSDRLTFERSSMTTRPSRNTAWRQWCRAVLCVTASA